MQNKNPIIAKVLNVLVFLFLYLPIAVLIVFSFNDSKSRTVWSGFSLHWYQELFQDEEILSAFSTTLTVSVLAALIATVLGTAAAIGFHSMKRRPRHLLLTINNIPMTNADIITGVSLMLLFVFTGNLLGFSLGFGTLLVAHITFNIPYVVLAVLPKLRQLNPNLGEAAMDLGATPWQAFWKVLMPELRPGILNGLLIAFTLSIDDFVISYFTAGSEVATLAMQIYAMTRKRISPEVNALSTILFVTVLTLLLIVNFREMHQTKQAEKRNKALQKDGVKGGAK
jgi:spermidine/putrescine transport system permease protein